MKNVILAGLVILAAWIQVNFLGALRPLDVIPNILMVVIICAGLTRGPDETLLMALGGGLLIDFASGADFGLRMAYFSVLALIVLVLKQAGAEMENIGLVVLVAVVATLLYNAAVLANLVWQRAPIDWGLVLRLTGKEALLNSLFVVILRPLLVRVLRQPTANLLRG
jgi:rod shape-determining protein MreD